jgi:GNAT superfamily N-acetyltransferase
MGSRAGCASAISGGCERRRRGRGGRGAAGAVSAVGAGALVFRRARREDVPALVALYADDMLGAAREATSGPLPPSYFEAFAAIDGDANQELVVVERDGALVGTCQLTWLWHLSHGGSRVLQVEAVRIARALRGGGLGAQLMQWVIARGRAAGCRHVQLTSDQRRVDAHRFYERLGFVASHVGMKYKL